MIYFCYYSDSSPGYLHETESTEKYSFNIFLSLLEIECFFSDSMIISDSRIIKYYLIKLNVQKCTI